VLFDTGCIKAGDHFVSFRIDRSKKESMITAVAIPIFTQRKSGSSFEFIQHFPKIMESHMLAGISESFA
jgi:hypothetical protein